MSIPTTMHTVKFYIEPYLAEYLKTKWSIKDNDGKPTDIVAIPSDVYLYNLLASITIKKPRNAPDPSGNIEIVIPHRREGNKRPEYYNYISDGGARLFNKQIKLFFRANLHEFIDKKKHNEGMTYKEACFIFVGEHGIESMEPESLAKNYTRWKDVVRLNRKKSYVSR